MTEALQRRLPFVILALVTCVTTVSFYPWNADACFAVNDALWYAHAAETRGLDSINGHHPLFHLGLLPVTQLLDACGVEHPGHLAVRVVAGISLAAIILLMGALAGWRRRALLPLALLLVTRCIFIEVAVGESLALSAASILFALMLAADPAASLVRVGIATVIALLVRQDAILILPGILLALHLRTPAEQRSLKRLLLWLCATGIATLCLYLLFWKLSRVPQLATFLLRIVQEENRAWAQPTFPGALEFAFRFATLGAAVTGVQDHFAAFFLNIALGVVWLAVLYVVTRCAGGTGVPAPLRAGIIMVLVLHFGFYTWFEPQNFEWWFVDMVLIVALSCAGLRAPKRGVKPFAIALATACTAVILWAHGPSTCTLRDTTLVRAADVAAEWSRHSSQPVVVSYGYRAHTALHLRAIPHDANLLREPPEAEEAGRRLQKALAGSAGHPLVVLLDRFVGDGQPAQYSLTLDYLAPWLDEVPPIPPGRVWKQNGKSQVLWLELPK